jgi:hypothetical protein
MTDLNPRGPWVYSMTDAWVFVRFDFLPSWWPK